MVVICNPIRMGRWSELMIGCVCHSDDVMREADPNKTSGDLGLAFPWSLVGKAVFSTVQLEMLTESAIGCFSYRLFRSTRVNGENGKSPSISESVPVSMWSIDGE